MEGYLEPPNGIPCDATRKTTRFEYQTIYSHASWGVFWSVLNHVQMTSIRRQPFGAGNTPPSVSAFLSSCCCTDESPRYWKWHGHWLKPQLGNPGPIGKRNSNPPVCDSAKLGFHLKRNKNNSGLKCWCWLTWLTTPQHVVSSASPFSVVLYWSVALAAALNRPVEISQKFSRLKSVIFSLNRHNLLQYHHFWTDPSLNCFTRPQIKHTNVPYIATPK